MDKRQDFTDAEKLALTRASYVIRELGELSETITIPMVELLFMVAMNPGYGPQEYARRLDTLAPTLSNRLSILGQKKHRGEDPYDLVQEGPSLGDPRGKGFYLTTRGKSLMRRIIKAQGV